MPLRADIARKRKRKQKIELEIKSFIRLIRNLLIASITIVLLFIAVVILTHTIQTSEEKTALSEAGLYNQVTIFDKEKINVSSIGNKNGKHTVVTISDVGVQDFTLYTKYVTSAFQKDVEVTLIDRAGYGFSEDSDNEQTVEQIVTDYREALKNAEIDGPYILLAHNFGGVYATYWMQEYPDEIEAIIFIDGTKLTDEELDFTQEINSDWYRKSILYNIGFQRLMNDDIYTYASKDLSLDEAELSKALNTHSIYTSAYLSELSLMQENFKKVQENFTKTNIPKLYISVTDSFATEKDVIKYYEYKNEQATENGDPPFYNLAQSKNEIKEHVIEFINESKQIHNTKTKVFADALGNCQVTRIPGDVRIFEQKPVALSESIKDFISYLDGTISNVDDNYDDTRHVKWEEYAEVQ